MVINQQHSGFLRWIDRYPAYDCRVQLTFRRDNQIIVGPIDTKWTLAPECISPTVQVVVHQEPFNVQINDIDRFDSTKTAFAHLRTIFSDTGGQPFDVVVKNQDQNECYAFTGWSYGFPRFANPNLAIPIGTFTIEIRAISTNASSAIATFTLRNEGPDTNQITLV